MMFLLHQKKEKERKKKQILIRRQNIDIFALDGLMYLYLLGVQLLTRFEPNPIRYDPKINGSGMYLIFLIRIRSG
jgi:hypothetical protein